jgi:hypothetical protein
VGDGQVRDSLLFLDRTFFPAQKMEKSLSHTDLSENEKNKYFKMYQKNGLPCVPAGL